MRANKTGDMKRSLRVGAATLLAACWLVTLPSPGAAQIRVVPENGTLPDARLGELKDLNGYFPFDVPATTEQWQQRSAEVRRRVQVALGLWPPPAKTPLNAVVHGRRDMGDYTIEKVYFESMPGFFVTGNLYRPKTVKGKVPGVLCPHGHWSKGRFTDAGVDRVRKQIVNGEERFESGGRSPLQSRCVQLARMGCVVFHYDMIGYADSRQLSFDLVHRFGKQRPALISTEAWGFFSPQAESHLQSVMGLQTWNSIRSLDFLLSLPEVDPERLAVTGASGGGTQTFILAAVDPRVAVAMPCVMVSTAMQGGCTCENASLLRIGTGNVEIAGLFAPKPLGLTAANDWTREMSTKGFPQLKQLYQKLGAPNNVMLASLTHFGHNYNYVSRARMYSWFNRHLKLGLKEPIVEEDYQRLSPEEMTVWDEAHPAPPGGEAFEKQLLQQWRADVESQLEKLARGSDSDFAAYRRLVHEGLQTVLNGVVPQDASEFTFDETVKQDQGALVIGGILKHQPSGAANPVLFVLPKNWNGTVAIWVTGRGKAGVPDAIARKLVEQGVSLATIDLFQQGEYLPEGTATLGQQRKVKNPREAACYTYGYNDAVAARRVQDILRFIGFVKTHKRTPRQVWLIGTRGAGHLAAAARALAADAVDRTCIDTGGFRFLQVDSIRHPDFLPGGSRYGDLPGMLAQIAPHRLWIAGEGNALPKIVQQAYQRSGASNQLALEPSRENVDQAAVAWLLGSD